MVDVVGVAELGYPVFAGEKELLVCVVNDPTDIYLQRAEVRFSNNSGILMSTIPFCHEINHLKYRKR